MFIIEIKIHGEVEGYFCGFFKVNGERECGYEEDIECSRIKEYKKRTNAEKALKELKEIYQDEIFEFNIIDV